jgi:hypothetical protein
MQSYTFWRRGIGIHQKKGEKEKVFLCPNLKLNSHVA